MAYETDQLMSEISDHFAKNHDSNMFKVLDIFNSGMITADTELDEIAKSREIAKATGASLDLHGKDRQVSRISDDDDFYRFLISIKALLSTATGSFSSIKNIISQSLQTNDKIRVWQTEPHHIKISLPAMGKDSNEKQRIIINNLQELVALGNWLDGIQWEVAGNTNDYFGSMGFCSECCVGVVD